MARRTRGVEKLKPIGKIVLEMADRFFSLDQVVEKTRMHRCEVCHVLEKLCLERLVKRISSRMREQSQERRGRPYYDIRYRLINKEGLSKKIGPRLQEETAQDRMWRVIRLKSQTDGFFTRADVMTLAEVGPEHVKWFTKMLHRAGIVAPSRNAGPGVEWRLIKDVGPRRPYVRGKRK